MNSRHLHRLTAITVVGLTLMSCGGEDSSTESTPTTEGAISTEAPAVTEPAPDTSSTPDPAELANYYAAAGPYPVGVTTLELEAGNKVEIWYPAVAGTMGTDFYDVRDFVPDAIRALLTADVPAVYEYDAVRDAAMADGTYPVVLFSHGYSGIRLQSTFLTAHLASWGMVVVSPDHWSRDLFHVLSAPVGDRQSSIVELLASLDLISAENTLSGSIFEGRIDSSRVVAVGHSAGGGTIVGAAADDRIDGYVSLASGVGISSASTTTAPLTLPNKPSFFIAGALDGIISAQTSTKPSFEAVPAPSRLWIIDGVGHNGFDDFCTFGNGSGIIGVAIASGLGPLLEAQPQLKTLGEDGCVPPALDVNLGFPIIKHAVTSQIRFWFGDDAEAIGIGPEVADQYELAVEIVVRD
ncbi:MAG: hypothetical protein FJW09_01290 [Actinobacteria bacterium]|nr:hypothetical protein [Actinomycetota bacterium]